MLQEEKVSNGNPMNSLEDWDSDLVVRYPEPKNSSNANIGENKNNKKETEYRDYCKNDVRAATVKEFYRLNHSFQTFDFVLSKEKEFLKFNRKEMTIWEAIDYLNTLVDDSDPDIELDQTQHLLQTAESCRHDNQPDWFILTGFLHDLGKILCLFGEPQWAVVGDTFPVGCKFSDKIVFPEFFEANTDSNNPLYNTKLGVYKENCGLNNVKMSWGKNKNYYSYNIIH
jgi:inositol oxygenase